MVLIYSDKDGRQHKMNLKGRVYISNKMHNGDVMEIAVEETTSFNRESGEYDTDGGFDVFSTTPDYDIAVMPARMQNLHVLPIER